MSTFKIYCLPYAGGSKSVFNDWVKEYSDVGEIIPMEYNGHGELFCEPFYSDMSEMVNDISVRIMKDRPKEYMIYGHSLGSIVALLVAEKIEIEYSEKPKAVVVGGIRPAHLKYRDKSLLGLSKTEFMKHIFDMGQTDDEVMNDLELYDIIYDILYNDVKIEENFTFVESDHQKLSVPLVVMTGTNDDEAPIEDMMEWHKYTDSRFYIKSFLSDHFFPFKCDEFKQYFKSTIKKAKCNLL